MIWYPFPETMPEPTDYRKLYNVTMKDGSILFTTSAEWCKYSKGYRWEYRDRVNFPWKVIAWAELPEPYGETA